MRRTLALVLLVAACTEFPDIDVPGIDAAARAPYPELVPLTQALGRIDAPPRFSEAEAQALLARAGAIGTPGDAAAATTDARLARLRARAAVLRGPLATDEDAEAMRAALAHL